MVPIRSFKEKRGKIDLYFLEKNFAFYARPCGVIGLKLLQQYVVELKRIDQLHSEKFHHIVNTTNIRIANPLNPLILRAIRKLNNLGLYIVIVPNPFIRLLVYLSRWINKPDFVFKSLDECTDFFKKRRIK